jgi:hypothetical protein
MLFRTGLFNRMGMRNHISVGQHVYMPVGCSIEKEPQYGRKHEKQQTARMPYMCFLCQLCHDSKLYRAGLAVMIFCNHVKIKKMAYDGKKYFFYLTLFKFMNNSH